MILTIVKAAVRASREDRDMPTTLPPSPRPARKFPWIALSALFVLCVVPVIALLTVGAILDRNCKIEGKREGEAGTNMVWRIESQRCGDGPLVDNVLLAPRGKSFALVASSTGTPRPVAVDRTADGITSIRLEGNSGEVGKAFVLALSVTGRPRKPLVIANGQPKS